MSTIHEQLNYLKYMDKKLMMRNKKRTWIIARIISISMALLMISCKGGSSNQGTETGTGEQPEPVTEQISLQDAALNGLADAVNAMLEQGIDINNIDQDGRTALMYAAFNGHEDVVKSLLENDADVNISDNFGRTALMFASSGPFPGTVKILLDSDAEIDMADTEEHFTALMYAAAEGQLEVVEILLQNGADAELEDVDGDVAETFARNNGHTAVADFIASSSR